MTRMDVYFAAGIVAWLAGAYWIGAGHAARAAAMDRQTTATQWCSMEYLQMYGEEDARIVCEAIAKAHRERFR